MVIGQEIGGALVPVEDAEVSGKIRHLDQGMREIGAEVSGKIRHLDQGMRETGAEESGVQCVAVLGMHPHLLLTCRGLPLVVGPHRGMGTLLESNLIEVRL